MRRKHANAIVLIALLLPFTLARAAAAADEQTSGQTQDKGSCTAVVQRLQSSLLDAMKAGPKMDVSTRFAQLEPVIQATHDFDFIAPRVFGSGWEQLTDEQKHKIVDLYRRASTMTFAQQFNDYHGEKFQILDEKPASRGGRFVRSELHQPNGQTVHFNYLLHESDGQWRIINTDFDGVSGLSMDRGRYQPLLQQRGVDALIAELSKEASGQP